MESEIIGPASPDEPLERVRRYVGDHTDQVLDRQLLATLAGFSVPHLQRLFVWRVGVTVGRYVRLVRLERAARKLRMGAVDITQVALAAGYESHASFTKAFRQRYGMSPRDFRNLDCAAATHILNER